MIETDLTWLFGAAALITIFLGVKALVLGPLGQWRLNQSPYKMEITNNCYNPNTPDGSITFRRKIKLTGDKGRIGTDSLLGVMTAKVTSKISSRVQQYNIRFVKKLGHLWWKRIVDVPFDEARIEELTDPYYMAPLGNKVHPLPYEFNSQEDRKGGYNGNYNPPVPFPKGGLLWLQFAYVINVPRFTMYISFQNRLGDERRRYVRCKIKTVLNLQS